MASGTLGNLVCAGALCICKFGKSPAKFKVMAQKKHYINDASASSKLMATDKELNQPFEPPFFGSCSKMNNSPCKVSITEWDGYYEKITIENGGHPLLDGSKATCPVGAKGCISISFHGQTAIPSSSQAADADPTVMTQINPLVPVTAGANNKP